MGKNDRRSKNQDGGGPTAKEMSEKDEDQKPKEYDPDGTHDVRRGLTREEIRKQRHELLNSLNEKLKRKQERTKQKNPSSIYDEDYMPKPASKKKKLSKDKAVAARLEAKEAKQLKAKIAAMDAEDVLNTGSTGMLEAEHDMERTTALSQVELKRQLKDEDVVRHIYDLNLESPHGLKYDRSGRYALLYSSSINPQGHVAIMDCHTRTVVRGGEFYVQQPLRDATFLHNAQMMAVAPANSPVAIYDNDGTEIHSLTDHMDPLKLEFLPYHFLLASVNRSGFLKYTDTSTGKLICNHRTRGSPGETAYGIRAGNPVSMRQNPYNSVMHVGHSNGTVTLWSPASPKYLMKFLCHKGAAVTSMAIDLAGRVMVTGGADRQIKIWDMRNTYRELHGYFTPAGPPTSMDISQQNILGIGHAGHTTFWSASALQVKEKDPYMHHLIPRGGPIETLRFRPYEDVCGIGHAKGISSIVVPGSGEPNLDTSEYHTNPFEDTKRRREAEVRALLDKLSPDMITLNPEVIGGVEETDQHTRLEKIRDKQEEANLKPGEKKKQKNKKRGRSKIQTQLRRKHNNIVDQQTLRLREAREQELAQEEAERKKGSGAAPDETPQDNAPSALKRFFS